MSFSGFRTQSSILIYKMYRIKMRWSSPLAISLLSAVGLVFMLILTDPLELPLILLLIPFLLLFLLVRSICILIMPAFYREGSKRKTRFLATACAGIVLFVVILQSLGQLSWRDILLTVALISATAFYFKKTDLL